LRTTQRWRDFDVSKEPPPTGDISPRKKKRKEKRGLWVIYNWKVADVSGDLCHATREKPGALKKLSFFFSCAAFVTSIF
jgi:hypothetical protein